MAQLGEAADGLHPAEGLLDQLAAALADGVAGVPRRAPVDGAPALLAGHVRDRAQSAQAGHEVARVVAPVSADGEAPAPAAALPGHESQAGLALGGPGGLGELTLDDQAVAVLGQAVAGVAELGRLAVALAREPGLGVGGRAVGLRCRAAPRASRPRGCGRRRAGRRLVVVPCSSGRRLFSEAAASISVPSREKCSRDSSLCASA